LWTVGSAQSDGTDIGHLTDLLKIVLMPLDLDSPREPSDIRHLTDESGELFGKDSAMPEPTPPADTPVHPPGPASWLEFVDRWLHEPAIRRTLFAAFLVTLATLVLIVVAGGPLALACIFGPLSGGTGYALWRAKRSRTGPHP
jgi:hypothetical protein